MLDAIKDDAWSPWDEERVRKAHNFGRGTMKDHYRHNLMNAKVIVTEELYNGFFEVTAVSRDDLKAAGFMADEVDDKIMERLASKMADAYVESSFWTDLEIIAEDLGIKREE
jgi:hypothetical protein